MTPEVIFLAGTKFNWPDFRATIDKALNLRPDIIINKVPVDFSDDAKVLLNIAAFYGWDITNPLNTLRHLPPMFLEYLSYQFFIACDQSALDQIHFNKITIIKNKIPDGYLILATGSLAAWFDTIVSNLGRDWEYETNTRILICKIMLLLEKRGLNVLFDKHRKKMQKDGTFLLESK